MKEQKRGNRRTVNFYLLGFEQWLETFQKNSLISYIHGIKPTDKEQLFSDRDNLYLLVKPTGVKIWRFIYTHLITKNALKNLFGIIQQSHLLSLEIRLVYGAGYWHKV